MSQVSNKNMKSAKPSTLPKKKPPKFVKVNDVTGKERLVYTAPECVMHYLEASINPAEAAPGACLPADFLPLPSQKVKGFCKGSFATSTSGVGYVSVSPCTANDGIAVTSTTLTSVGDLNTVASVFTNLQTGSCENLPYSTADFSGSSSLKCRNVAYGIRVRATSAMMNRGGSYVAAETEDHFSAGGYSYNQLKSTNVSKTYAVPSTWNPESWDCSVSTSGPVDPRELSYGTNSYGDFAAGLIPDPLIVMVNSATAGQTFDFEYYCHVEYIGTAVGDRKTRAHSSPTGFSSAIEAMKDHTVKHGPVNQDSGPSILDSFKNFFMEEGPKLLQVGAGAARMLLGDETGILQIADGSMKMIQDSFKPERIPGRHLTDTQRSILAPDASVYRR